MTAYLALLRGINVGGRNTIAMATLRALLTELGHEDVSTYLQSGNALFTSSSSDPDVLAAELEEAITEEFGLTVRCLVRRREDLQRVVAHNPLAEVATDWARYYVVFLNVKTDLSLLSTVDSETYLPERFAWGEREIFTWHPGTVHRSKLTTVRWERLLGSKTTDVVATARNWRTVTKLLALMS